MTEENDVDIAFFVHEVVGLHPEEVSMNEKNIIPSMLITQSIEHYVWYLDNGASNHMSGNQSYFLELNKNVTGKVRLVMVRVSRLKGKV